MKFFLNILIFILGSTTAKGATKRFNVTVVSTGAIEDGPPLPTSPAPRHRTYPPFCSIPEDHALDNPGDMDNPMSQDSRSESPALSWDFSNEESDSVSNVKIKL